MPPKILLTVGAIVEETASANNRVRNREIILIRAGHKDSFELIQLITHNLERMLRRDLARYKEFRLTEIVGL